MAELHTLPPTAASTRSAGESAASPRLKYAVVAAIVAVNALEVVFAARTALYFDEAFYWQCAQRLAPAYADHPFMTALLVRAGTVPAGDTHLGVRLAFLVLGAAIPAAVGFLAWPVVGSRRAWLAAGLSSAAPLLALGGIVAGPDVPLVLFATAGMAAFERATRPPPGSGSSLLPWLAAGALAALGLCTHYRFGLVAFAALVYLVATPRGRGHLRTAGPWLAGVLAALGLVPVLSFNAQHDFASLSFQFVERHGAGRIQPIRWLLHPLVQACLVSPLLYAAFLAALVGAWRGARASGAGDDRRLFLALFGTVPLATYFATSPFATDRFVHFHWPAWGYIPLCVLLPEWLERRAERGGWRRAFALAAPATAFASSVLVLLGATTGLFGLRARLTPFVGWHELAAEVRARLPAAPAGEPPIVVADSYIQAAQIDFELAGLAEVFTLDHPRNPYSGRALQYALWGRDEAGLRARAGRDALVAVEPPNHPSTSLAGWMRHVEALFERVEALDSVSLPAGSQPRVVHFLRGLGIRP